MPKLLRNVEQEVSHETLIAELAEMAKQVIQPGAFLPTPEGLPDEQIFDGDVLVPSAETYAQGVIAPETHAYVIRAIGDAALVWACFHRPNGQLGLQFFTPQAFVSKVKLPGASVRKAAKKAKK